METDRPNPFDTLYRRSLFGIKLGLETMESLLHQLGDPHEGFDSIHVAGTNGKGSVCAMMESVLRQAGFCTGLYTSPHLVRFNERFKVDGEEIPDEDLHDLVRLVEGVDAKRTAASGDREATFFECATAIAFAYFQRLRVDIAVVETGMGGRLDATNVLGPELCVITSIDIDHAMHLGDTRTDIAGEKAGILKPGTTAVVAPQRPEVYEILQRKAVETKSLLVKAEEVVSARVIKQDEHGQKIIVEHQNGQAWTFNLPLTGSRQVINAMTAITALECYEELLLGSWTQDCLVPGLEKVSWPARFQLLRGDPPTILDAAHNPQSAEAVASTLKKIYPEQSRGLIFGCSQQKDVDKILRALGHGTFKKVWAVELQNERGLPLDELCLAMEMSGFSFSQQPLPVALDQAWAWATENNGVVCITGSVYLAGEVLTLWDQKTQGLRKGKGSD